MNTKPPQPLDENAIIAERRDKLAALRQLGPAFPNDFRREHLAAALHERYSGESNESLETLAVNASVAGRMMLKRVMGKASFATLQDMSGRVQLFVSDDHTGAEAHAAFKHFDLGDIVAARGTLFRTRAGELTLRVNEIRLLTKAIRPLPEKFHGLTDREQRYRQRYLDLITNAEARATFIKRSAIVQAMRDFLSGGGFLEVETPMMQPLPGGATARPFVTHHNALNRQLYLRVAPELYLKRLVVGGFERVFEINRNFRNEGISTRHNPEFTMLEFYAAYQDYRYLMDFIEGLLAHCAKTATGATKVHYQGEDIDLGGSYARLSVTEAVLKYHPELAPERLQDANWLRAELAANGAPAPAAAGLGALQLAYFEQTTEAKLIQPTFVVDYPAEVSPLARRSDSQPELTERFELYIAGRELANGFSELNDPEDQAERFAVQARAKEAGDHEAMYFDHDYVRALEHGMPPAAGAGIGVDRLVMLLTDAASIRDVILFPQLRTEEP
jgi:lysyl-tRNA synthetase class 2